MIAKKLAAALAVASALAAAPAAWADCQFKKLAELPVTMEGMRPTIMTQINGRDAKFMIDTGAFFGAVSPDTAAAYNMRHAAVPPGMQVRVVGGATRDIQAVQADNFTFAGVGFKGTEFMVMGRIGSGDPVRSSRVSSRSKSTALITT